MSDIDISAWGDTPPEFIRVLASVVQQEGNRAAASRRLGIDRASISTLLANKYPACTNKMEKTIMAWAGGVECPIRGRISADECQTEREKPFIGSNPRRIQQYRACRNCSHNPKCRENRHE